MVNLDKDGNLKGSLNLASERQPRSDAQDLSEQNRADTVATIKTVATLALAAFVAFLLCSETGQGIIASLVRVMMK